MTERRYGSTAGHGLRLWPVIALLGLIVLVPTACVLWFMTKAMENERLAARQRLSDLSLVQLRTVREGVGAIWESRLEALSRVDEGEAPARTFHAVVTGGHADGFIVRNGRGEVLYPSLSPPDVEVEQATSGTWALARQLEFERGEPLLAADAYRALGARGSSPPMTALALQAEARCRAKGGETEEAIRILTEELDREPYREALDAHGRPILPNVLLRGLQLMPGPDDERFELTANRLVSILNDYDGPPLGSAQRVFLMKEVQAVLPAGERFPTLDAEDLAQEYLRRYSPVTQAVSLSTLYIPSPASRVDGEASLPYLRPSVLSGVWEIDTPGGNGIALYRQGRIIAEAGGIEVLAPGVPSGREASVSLPANPPLVGWQLTSDLPTLEGRAPVAYLWIGILLVGVMVAMAALVARLVGRQMRIARLKNDLVATVSHELKTPLSSIRLLTETLLDGHYEDAERTREYLDLISKENTRLGRLIDNFLAFSRMERGKAAFDLVPVSPRKIAEEAVGAVGEKIDVEIMIEEDLPEVTADRDAMVTVLVNLLDNAHKYSQDDRRVTLRVRREGGGVCFDVEDRGIGLTRRAARRVFDRFYQVDRGLSREVGGVGLGLSIVRFVVDAHGGSVGVRSDLGTGSTFTVRLPGGGQHGR